MMEQLLTSSVLILAVLGIRLLLRGRRAARLQYALWLLVALRLLIPGSLASLPWSALSLAEDAGLNQAVESVRYETRPETAAAPAATEQVFEAPDAPADTAWPDGAVGEMEQNVQPEAAEKTDSGRDRVESSVARDRFAVLRIVWYAGMGLMALWFLCSNLRFGRRLRRTARPTDVQAARPVYAADLPSPCLWGLFRPSIYVTPACLREPRQLRHVLAHEEAHLRHGDQFWSLVRCACLVVWWFDPLVWLAAFLSRRDCELAADETAVLHLGEPERLAYGRTLLDVVAQGTAPGSLLQTATTMHAGTRSLRERIARLAAAKPMKVWLLILTLALLAATAGCVFSGSRESEQAVLRQIRPYLAESVGGPDDYALILLRDPKAAAALAGIEWELRETMPVYETLEMPSRTAGELDETARQYAERGGTSITASESQYDDGGVLYEKQYVCGDGMEIDVWTSGAVTLLFPAAGIDGDPEDPAYGQAVCERYGAYLDLDSPACRLNLENWQPQSVIFDGVPTAELPCPKRAGFLADSNGRDCLYLFPARDMGECLGNYPVISQEGAEAILLSGGGTVESGGWCPVTDAAQILGCYLDYLGDPCQPVYVFLVEATAEVAQRYLAEAGMEDSGELYVCQRYFVPAVDPAYLIPADTAAVPEPEPEAAEEAEAPERYPGELPASPDLFDGMLYSTKGTYTDSLGNEWDYSYEIPLIRFDCEDAETVNREIRDGMGAKVAEELANMEEGLSLSVNRVSYQRAGKDRIVTLILKAEYVWEYTDYAVYHYDRDLNRFLTNEEMLRRLGINPESCLGVLREAAEQEFLDSVPDGDLEVLGGQEFYDRQYAATLSEENLNLDTMLFFQGGKLYAIVPIYGFAGAEWYYHIIPINI